MALKPFWNKKYHLGMTGDEVKAGIKAGAAIPKIEDGDAGKAVVVNEAGTGFELTEVGGGPAIVNLLYTSTPGVMWYTDKSVSEIMSLAANGEVVFKYTTELGGEYEYYYFQVALIHDYGCNIFGYDLLNDDFPSANQQMDVMEIGGKNVYVLAQK